MIVPLGTDRRLHRPTLVTYWLIGLNILIFVVGAIYGSPRVNPDGLQRIFTAFWLDPDHPRAWQFITYQFLHGGILHLLGNMLFLYVFGPNVEDRLGRWAFLAFYLVGGAVAGGAHFLFESDPVVGASGAIAAVTGAYLVLFPNTNIRVFVFFFIIGVFHFRAWWLIAFAIVKDLVFAGWGTDHSVARLAHLGGYVFGAVVCFALLATGLLARESYDLFSMGRQAHRRRVFRELASSGKTAWVHEAGPRAKVMKSSRNEPVKDDPLAAARSEVARLVSEGDLDRAAAEWERLMELHGEVCLPRQAHLDVANHLVATARRQSAAVAYEIFLKRFSGDRQAQEVRLMLAVLSARYLNDPVRARQLIDEARRAGLRDDQQELAGSLEQEIA